MSRTKPPPDVIQARAETARRAERTRRTLREYAPKLHDIADRLRAITASAGGTFSTSLTDVDRDAAVALLRCRRVIAAAVEWFARSASGLVEQGAMEASLRAELLLRLREAENALDEAKEAAAALQRRFSDWCRPRSKRSGSKTPACPS